MASPSPLPLLLLLLLLSAAAAAASSAAALGFDIHHRFSEPVRRWAESRRHPGAWWPEAPQGSAEYYAALARHDQALLLHRRNLAGDAAAPAPAPPHPRARLRRRELHLPPQLPRTLGTPNVTFLVALDTGSDLFWVPCDCKQCAPTTSPFNFEFNIYSPSQSSTSKKVPCSSSFCDLRSTCTGANSSCPYVVEYMTENTSTSGVLVEDVLYFTQEDARSKIVEAPVVFGCGQFQTGSFLDAAAPNGLFGLGMKKTSVPSILSSKGLTSNSFSMCFGSDGIGRINFGDKGSAGQDETPFNVDNSYPQYNISITGLQVGNKTTQAEVYALVDSGTSITLLADPLYTQLGQAFTSQVKGSRFTSDPSVPFEYCYRLGQNQTTVSTLEMGFITKNGNLYPVLHPYALLYNTQPRTLVAYCLAIVKSSNVNIIGENFMIGLRLVFDRERLVLGWEKFNCYNDTSSSTLPVNGNSSAPAPAAFAPSSFTPEATKQKPNNAQAPAAPPRSSHSSHLNVMANKFLVLFLLVVAIL
ncbi:Aspartic proteinase-like protein 1 [Ananas comosus]|uniref:Aspartic proteinase-like protein 1 n=1 Tax=Ananas comosus TaxID=4615 RepID=A0A199VLN0_ANACO|nr:Aspartic proteinase-like protein 1 [Ananas comosus]